MKVATIRERLLHRVAAVVQAGSLDDVFLVSDQLRIVAGALAQLPGDAEVDLDACTVDTAQAAQMLSYHAEHVRRLIRQGSIRSTKVGADYRIPLTEIFAALVRRHHEGPIPPLLPGLRPEAVEVSANERDLEIAIDVMVKRGPERQAVRLQRINVGLGELLRDRASKLEAEDGGGSVHG